MYYGLPAVGIIMIDRIDGNSGSVMIRSILRRKAFARRQQGKEDVR